MVSKNKKHRNNGRYRPGGIQFQEDILLVIVDNFFEVLPNEDDNRLILSGRNRLALELGLKFTIDKLSNPSLDSLSREIFALIVRVFELLLDVLDDESGPFGLTKIESLGVVTELEGVDPNKVHLLLIFSGHRFDSSNMCFFVFKSGVEEEIREGLGATSVEVVVLSVNLINDGDSEFRNPIFDVFLGKGRRDRDWELGLGFVESAVDDNGWRFDASGFDGVFVSGETEEVVITVALSGSAERGRRVFGSRNEISDGNDFVGLLEFLMVSGGDFRDSGE